MTTTTGAAQADLERTGGPAGTQGGTGSAILTGAPQPRPTLPRTFAAMMAREGRVLRRNAVATFTRSVMQPLLFVFVFTYVMPKIGGGFMFGGGASTAAAAGGAAASSVNCATILVPGLMASMPPMQEIGRASCRERV